jgi:selenocysteine lyase/cysteine desulfurase
MNLADRPCLQALASVRERIVGVEQQVPVLDGSMRRYVNLDNAATTPVLREVLGTVNHFMAWYSSVHRGAGFKSRVATRAYEDARQTVVAFVGANPHDHTVIFGKNCTEAINKLSYRLALEPDDVVLVSLLEHHSNDLPWRARARVFHVRADEFGNVDEADLDRLLHVNIGMNNIARHESELTAYALQRLARVDGLRIYGSADPKGSALRLGVIPFNLGPIPHGLVAAILGTEFGMGVRNGCFCAHPYLTHLLGVTPSDADRLRADLQAGDRTRVPGMVRISFGLYNSFDEVDALLDALGAIARGAYQGSYVQDPASGEYSARGWSPDLGTL